MDENNNVVVRVPEQQFIRGEDGYSPVVTIEEIEHGHSVTITDREHQEEGQTFNVLDGASAYEQAVAGGYTGTEEEFNADLSSFKTIHDEVEEVAPFYAEYGVTTRSEVYAAINNKRQVYVRTNVFPETMILPLTNEFMASDWRTGYRFMLTRGTTQHVCELTSAWTSYANDLSAPADRAEAAAQQALNRMNSADQSAQSAARSASDASRDAGTASTAATTATTKAGEASDSATAADGSAKDSEAYAIGKRGGTDVGSTDPAYHNNAKYYADEAGETVRTFTETTAPAAVQAVDTAGQTQVQAVNTAGAAKVQDVNTAGQTALTAIQQKGEDTLASIPADYTKLSEDVDDLKSALTVEKYGVPTEFANVFINNTGAEAESAKVLTGNRYYNYLQDGLVSIEAPEPYAIWGYAWIRAVMKGSIKTDGSISYTGTTANLHKLNLSEYPEYLFRFALVKIENGDRVDIDPSEAVNVKFTFKTNNALSNRRFSVMGDSISSFDGYTTPGSPNAYYPSTLAKVYHLENMYWKYLADRNGMSVEVIDAYAGSTVADKWQDTVRVPFYDDSRVDRLGEPDIIIVQGGINDFGGNPLGEYPAIGDYSKTHEFRTAYSLLLNKLKTKYKQATIVCLSMISPRSYNNTTFPEKQTEVVQALATDTTPHTFAEFNESIEKIAKQYQCAYCDITDLLNYYINPTSSLGPHWYFNLHMDVAYRIEQKLKEIYA